MKCYHPNWVSIFNSQIGCAYCPDCGKAPMSYEECGSALVGPDPFKELKEKLARDILNECPEKKCKMCRMLRKKYPYLK